MKIMNLKIKNKKKLIKLLDYLKQWIKKKNQKLKKAKEKK